MSKIDWEYPEPRAGILGEWDKFIGPGTTRAELWLELGFAVLGAALVPFYSQKAGANWTGWQMAVAILIGFDLAGGVVVNASSAAKRWYHRAGQGFWQHFGFIAVHLAHIFLVAWLFAGMDWGFFVSMSLYLLLGSTLILGSPLYLRRPIAMGLVAFALPFNLYLFPSPAGMEWFVPFLFLKLMVSHTLREEPYQP